MPLPKLSLGIPFYGSVANEWWVQLAQHTSELHKWVDFKGIIGMGTMTADHSRNSIVDDFLKTDSEWLFWIDSDTVVPIGAIPRLLAVGKTLVSGLYYGKNPPNPPIAYHIFNGGYAPIDQSLRWEKGEILPVDATGMGCMLTHRSVYEDILKNYELYQIKGGGLWPVHKADLNGIVTAEGQHEHDGKVYKGQLRTRLIPVTLSNVKFPFFMISHMMTEDMFFFSLARRVGHKPWLDTSVECQHLRQVGYTGEEYRSVHGH